MWKKKISWMTIRVIREYSYRALLGPTGVRLNKVGFYRLPSRMTSLPPCPPLSPPNSCWPRFSWTAAPSCSRDRGQGVSPPLRIAQLSGHLSTESSVFPSAMETNNWIGSIVWICSFFLISHQFVSSVRSSHWHLSNVFLHVSVLHFWPGVQGFH